MSYSPITNTDSRIPCHDSTSKPSNLELTNAVCSLISYPSLPSRNVAYARRPHIPLLVLTWIPFLPQLSAAPHARSSPSVNPHLHPKTSTLCTNAYIPLFQCLSLLRRLIGVRRHKTRKGSIINRASGEIPPQSYDDRENQPGTPYIGRCS